MVWENVDFQAPCPLLRPSLGLIGLSPVIPLAPPRLMRSHLPILQGWGDGNQTIALHLGSYLYRQDPVPVFCRTASDGREGTCPVGLHHQAGCCVEPCIHMSCQPPPPPPRTNIKSCCLMIYMGKGEAGAERLKNFQEATQVS